MVSKSVSKPHVAAVKSTEKPHAPAAKSVPKPAVKSAPKPHVVAVKSAPKPQASTVKSTGKPVASTETNKPKGQAKPSKKAQDNILQDILALGGDETDLDLLRFVDDQDEMQGEAADDIDAGLLKELKAFMKNSLHLNPSKSVMEELDTDDEVEVEVAVPIVALPIQPVVASIPAPIVIPSIVERRSEKEVDLANEIHNFLQTGDDVTNMGDMIHSGKIMVQPASQWYTFEVEKLTKAKSLPPTSDMLRSITLKAKTLWEQDTTVYDSMKKPGSSSADQDFIATVLKSGTVTDKISALTLLVQESPVHSFRLLKDQLVEGMAKKKARTQALQAIDSIKDLAIGNLLPNRKLAYFIDQPLLEKGVTSGHLILWIFEDELKKLYFEFISILEEMSMDPLPHVKVKVLSIIYELLASKPEQEQNLLTLLVNKMGDQDRKVASKACHLLSQLLTRHPVMKAVVVKEVNRLIFRSNMGIRAQYYAITFLNQLVLTKKETDVEAAGQLISIYFALFEILVKKLDAPYQEAKEKQEKKDKKNGKDKKKEVKPVNTVVDGIDAKMMAALLTGVNRAFPFAKTDHTVFEEQMNMLFKIVHIGSFNTSIQALNLIYQVQSGREMVSDRFYNVLYDSLLNDRLYTSSKQALYLNLLYKSLKDDTVTNRLLAFVKRIVQICSRAQVPFTCAALFLIGELGRTKPCLWSLVSQPEEEAEEHFKDVESDDEETIAKEAMVCGYDARKRDPRFAKAQETCLWELSQFTNHFHPTVALYAKKLLSHESISVPEDATNYDPLQNHTLSRFLDRFLYKAPKKLKDMNHGSSLMQPRRIGVVSEDRFVAGGKKKMNAIYDDQEQQSLLYLEDAPVNEVNWHEKNVDSIAPDEMFFFNYFKSQNKNREVVEEVDEVASDQDLEENDIWDAMQKSVGFPTEATHVDGDSDIEYDEALDQEALDEEFDFAEEPTLDDDLLSSDEDDNDDMNQWAQESSENIGSEDELTQQDFDGESEQEDDELDQEEEQENGDESDDDVQFEFVDSDEEVEVEVEKKPIKPSRRVQKISGKALEMGYKGDYFKRKTMNEGDMSAFADADDFEALLESNSHGLDDGPSIKKQRR